MYDELVKRLRNLSGTGNIAELDEAADAIEELSKPRWIPVTERLPEEWKSVLTYQPYVGDEEKPLIRVSWYIGVGSWRECERANKLELPVTHWMPLPEPPKEET